MPDRPVLVVVSGPRGLGQDHAGRNISEERISHLAEDAWRLQAPKRLIAERDREG